MALNPKTGSIKELMSGIFFANGVAVSQGADFIAVVSTASWHVYRYWLNGPNAGERDVLTDQLPGFPDGISRSKEGEGFWISIILPHNPLLYILPYRWMRWAVAWLLQIVSAPQGRWGCLLQVTEEGKVMRMLMDQGGSSTAFVTAIAETDRHIFMGSIAEDYVASFDKALLPPIFTAQE